MLRWNSFTLRCCALTLAFMGVGCKGEDAGAPLVPNAANVVRKLDLNHKVVMLTKNAPYDTVQLRAVPISLTGDTVPFNGQVIYSKRVVSDTSVQVDSFTGMVHARVATGSNSVSVIARLVMGADTLKDTVKIMVRNDAIFRPVGSVEISPTFIGDSAVRWLGITTDVDFDQWVQVFDTDNAPISFNQRLADVRVQRPEVAYDAFSYPNTSGSAVGASGESYIYARLYAYGQEFRDSVLFRRIVPPIRIVTIDRFFPLQGDTTITFYPGTTHAKVGTTIFFTNMFGYSEHHAVDGIFGLGCLFTPSQFCGNRARYSTAEGFLGSELVWTDSVDIVFDQPSMALAGDSYGFIALRRIRNRDFPSDGSSGNIPAFSVMYCHIIVDFPDNDTCGQGFPSFSPFDVEGTYPLVDPGLRGRKFMTPGTYHFSSTRYPGVTGTIIVTP